MEQKSLEPKPELEATNAAGDAPPRIKGIDRRTLLRAGASAAPVLMTLHSGPVSATGTMACTVASSFVSAATFASRSPGATYIKCSTKNVGSWCDQAAVDCPGNSPSVWWKSWGKSTVNTHLGCTTNSTYKDWYVGNVMKQTMASSGELGVLQHILGLTITMQYASSYIQNSGAPGGDLDKPYLAGVWDQYKRTGRYTMAAQNIDWDEPGLIQWLKMLQYDIPIS